MEETKSILSSKTFYWNVVLGILALAVPWAGAHHWLNPDDQSFLTQVFGLVGAAGNMGLRAITTQPVTLPFTKEEKKP